MTEISSSSIYPHQHRKNSYHYYQCFKQLMVILKIEEEQLGRETQIITEERIHYIDD